MKALTKTRHLCLAMLLLLPSLSISAQKAANGSNWQRVMALPVHTNVHITTDHGGKTCRIFAVSDNSLTCAKGGSKAGAVLQRAEIKHIKLTHHVRSTLVGAGIGGGIGAVSGAIGGRTKPCPNGQGFCFQDILSDADAAALFGIGGGIVGSLIGGVTDFARGSSIYVRQ